MKLIRWFLTCFALISILLMPKISFASHGVERAEVRTEHIDPLTKFSTSSKETLNKWFHEQEIGGKNIEQARRLEQWKPTTLDEWEEVWKKFSYAGNLLFAAGPFHKLTAEEKEHALNYMIDKMPVNTDSAKSIDNLAKISEFITNSKLDPVIKERLTNALEKKYIAVFSEIKSSTDNPVEKLKKLNDFIEKLPKNIKESKENSIKKMFEEVEEEREVISMRLIISLNFAEQSPTDQIKILTNLSEKFPTFFQYKTFARFFEHNMENWAAKNLATWNKIKNKPDSLQTEVLKSYQDELLFLQAYLKALKNNNINNEHTKAVAKRFYELSKFLEAKKGTLTKLGDWLASFVQSSEDLQKEIADKEYIKKIDQMFTSNELNNFNMLPEDSIALVEIALQNAATENSEDIIKQLEDAKKAFPFLTFAGQYKHGTTISTNLKNSTDRKNKEIEKLNSKLSSLTKDEWEKRKTLLNDLQTIYTYLQKTSSINSSLQQKTAEAILKTIPIIIDQAKKEEHDLQVRIDQQIKDAISDINKNSRTNKNIDNLIKQCMFLDKYSYQEQTAAQNATDILTAWKEVITVAENVKKMTTLNVNSAETLGTFNKQMDQLKTQYESIFQKSLNYSTHDPDTTSSSRNDESRLAMMQQQVDILNKLKNLFEQNPYKTQKGKSYGWSEVSKKLNKEELVTEGLVTKSGTEDNPTFTTTEKHAKLQRMDQFFESIIRRQEQLEQFIKQYKLKKPEPFTIQSQELVELNLHLMIPDDRIDPLRKIYRTLLKDLLQENPNQEQISSFLKDHVFADTNKITLSETLKVINATEKLLKEQVMKPEPSELFLKNIIEYMLEVANATPKQRNSMIQEFADLFDKNKIIFGVLGLADPTLITRLDEATLKDAARTFSEQQKATDSWEAARLAIEKQQLQFGGREAKADYYEALATKTAVTAFVATRWGAYILQGIGIILGAAFGAALACIPGVNIAILVSIITFATLGGEVGNFIGKAVRKASGLEYLDSAFWGIPIGSAIVAGLAYWKMKKIAESIRPTSLEYTKLADEAIKYALPPKLEPQRTDLFAKLTQEFYNFFMKEIYNDTIDQQATELEKQKSAISQRLEHFSKAREEYCKKVNEILQLTRDKIITPASLSHITMDQLDETVKKALLQGKDQNVSREQGRILAKYKGLMISLGIECTKLQFAYYEGAKKIVSQFISTNLLSAATTEIPLRRTDESDDEFQKRCLEAYKDPKNQAIFQKMLEENFESLTDPEKYKKLNDQQKKESFIRQFSYWQSFHEKILEANKALQDIVKQYKNDDEYAKKFGKQDGEFIYEMYNDILNGSMNLTLSAYRTSVDNMLKAWKREPRIQIQPAATTTAPA